MVRLFTLIFLITTAWADTVQQSSFWEIYTDALRGDREAQYKTGVMYERGMGVEQNETIAAQWYEKSAIQGHVDGQYNLAIMYVAGRGVDKNEPLAMMWFALAAKQGDREARKLLIDMIDGKLDQPSKSSSSVGEGTYVAITPVTLACRENAKICTKPGGAGECTPLKTKTVLTSKSRLGSYYKISGIVTNHQWKDYPKEGWIDEESVEIRK